MATLAEIHGAPGTISVREAGKRLGLCRDAAYEAVRRGEIQTVRVGGVLRVPEAKLPPKRI